MKEFENPQTLSGAISSNCEAERPRAPTISQRQALIQRAEQKKRKLERLKRGQNS